MRRLVSRVALLFLVLPAAGHAQPSRAQTETLLAEIDNAFNAADLDALLAHFHFQPGHTAIDAQLEARMKAVLAYGARLRRCTRIVEFQQRHGRAIALVRCRTSCAKNPNLHHAEHAYVVACTTADGTKAEVMVPVNDQALAQVKKHRFRCPACNYTFGGSSRWLAIPARPDQTGCMESLTFLALGLNLVVEVSVHVLDETLPAKEALTRLLQDMKTLPWIKAAQHTPVRSWLPPAYARGKAPACLEGARCQAPLRDGNTADIHLATFGPIRYLMVVQGPKDVLAAQQDTIRELLEGFQLLDTKSDPAKICQRAIDAHAGGGRIRGNKYENPVQNLKLTAPPGWKGRAYASRHLFRVRFESRAGDSHLVLQAMAPRLAPSWTREAASQLFQQCCAERQLANTADSDWQRGVFRWREVKGTSPQRILRLAVRPDVLVLMEGEAPDQAGLEQVRKAMASLALLRD